MKEYLDVKYKRSESIEYQVVPNAVLDNHLISKSKESVDHKWYNNDEIFVITAVGRLTNQKDFINLINALPSVDLPEPLSPTSPNVSPL